MLTPAQQLDGMIDGYNAIVQLAVGGPALVAQARAQVEADYQQRVADATPETRVANEAEARAKATAQQAQIEFWEQRIAYQRGEAVTLLHKDRLSKRGLQQIIEDPAVQPAPPAEPPMHSLQILVEQIDQEVVKLRSLSEPFWLMVDARRSALSRRSSGRFFAPIRRAITRWLS